MTGSRLAPRRHPRPPFGGAGPGSPGPRADGARGAARQRAARGAAPRPPVTGDHRRTSRASPGPAGRTEPGATHHAHRLGTLRSSSAHRGRGGEPAAGRSPGPARRTTAAQGLDDARRGCARRPERHERRHVSCCAPAAGQRVTGCAPSVAHRRRPWLHGRSAAPRGRYRRCTPSWSAHRRTAAQPRTRAPAKRRALDRQPYPVINAGAAPLPQSPAPAAAHLAPRRSTAEPRASPRARPPQHRHDPALRQDRTAPSPMRLRRHRKVEASTAPTAAARDGPVARPPRHHRCSATATHPTTRARRASSRSANLQYFQPASSSGPRAQHKTPPKPDQSSCSQAAQQDRDSEHQTADNDHPHKPERA